jgi:hypothetical protein
MSGQDIRETSHKELLERKKKHGTDFVKHNQFSTDFFIQLCSRSQLRSQTS